MTSLTDLPEIGPVTAAQLAAVGIHHAEALRAVGEREAFNRIRLQVDSGACLQLLYGLEGAVQGLRAHDLAPDDKAELCQWFRSLDCSATNQR
jgi:DNA transformation protein